MQTSLPHCLGFIMDGNRRYATEQGLPVLEGHRKGAEVLSQAIEFFAEAGIPHLVFYAFSTENWQRKPEEVEQLLDLFMHSLDRLEADVDNDTATKFRLRVIGDLSAFSPEFTTKLQSVIDKGAQHTSATTVWIALSYGGRAELITAINQAISLGQSVTEQSFEKLLWTAELPEPDMIVRTSGEQRLSNFLTWKSVYSELHFLSTHWPALSKTDFMTILSEYEKRHRRHGR